MENEIKVGEWIRTNWGHIGKLKRIELDKNDKGLKWYVFDHKEFEINIIKEEYNNKPDIVKYSPNIIDLIEVGDYVNGCRVQGFYDDTIELFGLLHNILTEDIKTIVTKEQFASIEYKVKE